MLIFRHGQVCLSEEKCVEQKTNTAMMDALTAWMRNEKMMVPKPTEAEGKRIDEYFKSKYVRQIQGAIYSYFCDRCRQWTDQPDRHNHEERPLD